MIALLRKKFILITMGSLILVLAVLMGAVNTVNYVKLDRSSDQILQILADNGGVFPDEGKHLGRALQPPSAVSGTVASGTAAASSGSGGTEDADDADTSTAEDADDADTDGTEDADDADTSTAENALPVPPAGFSGRGGYSAETPYETRFFSVLLDKNGALSSVNTGKIAAVTTEQAVTMARELWSQGRQSGYEENYKYLAAAQSGGTLYVFLDCTRDLSSFKSFLSVSLLVSLCGILAVFALVMVLSKRAIRPVAESYEKQKQFITNAGHEIKTPLAIIDSCTEVLEMEQGENKWTAGIRGQVRRLTALTQSLVSLARMDEGSANLPMEDFDLTDAVEDALAPFALLAEQHGLRLRTEIQSGLRCRGNEQTLRQLCSILADNAVKYALPGSEIRFSLARRGRKTVLSCENEASGLTPGNQNILFDRFYRGDTSHSSEKGGYGIGLSMAQSIVAAHGGWIDAKSPDGKTLIITAQF